MNAYSEATKLQQLVVDASHVVIMQADNPDGDSLGSALALEQIIGDMGKEVTLYCGVDIPTYLRYLPGWDRVQKDIPSSFDLTIIVDTSAISLFENLEKSGQLSTIKSKPCIIVDHHDVESSIPFATVVCNYPAVSTGEVIYELAEQLKWPTNPVAMEMIAISILSDSLGLVSEATTGRSIRIMAELVEKGVRLAQLENRRREMMRKSPELVRYKGELLNRIEYHHDNRVATIMIPWKEIEMYSHAYNPSMLVIDDMRLTEGTDIAIAFKTYQNGRVTAKIRTNFGKTIAADLAKAFGGGGHAYASGFKVDDGRSYEEIKQACIQKAVELLDKLGEEQ